MVEEWEDEEKIPVKKDVPAPKKEVPAQKSDG